MNTRDTFRWDNGLSNRIRLRRRAPRQARGPRPRRLRIECLEDRRMLADTVAHWIGGSGNWSDPANWDIGVVPNNSGSTRYSVVIDALSANPTITVDGSVTVDALTNAEAVHVTKGSLTVSTRADNGGVLAVKASSATLILSGNVSNVGDLLATAGTLRLANAMVASSARTITADGGIVEIKDSTITGGSLRATDNAASFVQFSGNVTLNGVPWEDPGAGEFRVYNTTAKLLGDYAEQLPAGYTLAVATKGQPSQLTLAGGVFTNNGTICLKEIYNSIQTSPRLFLESDTTLAGSGQVSLASDQSLIQGVAGTTLTIGADQWLHGGGGHFSGGIALPVVNHGLIEADATFQFNTLEFEQSVVNHGTMRATGGGTLEVLGAVTNQGLIEIQSGTNVKFLGGTTNTGTIDLKPDGDLTLGGQVVWAEDMVSPSGAALRFSGAQFDNTGHTVTADGGIVEIKDSTITGGSLRATDSAASFVQFSGDVTLNGVAWEDPGAGEFRVYRTTATFLADYAQGLPAGYTLSVVSQDRGKAQLRLAGGLYANDGTIRLREIPSQYGTAPQLYLESDTTLAGSGTVSLESTTATILGAGGVALSVAAGQRVRGYGGYWGPTYGITVPVVNHGLIEADATFQFNTLKFQQSVVNHGTMRATGGGTLEVSGAVTNQGLIEIQSGSNVKLLGGTTNTGTIDLKPDGDLTLGGQVVWGEDLISPAGAALRFSEAQFDNTGRTITADGGIVEITDSTVTGGTLVATDNADSHVQFSGDVTLNGVPWARPGAGDFRVYNTTARLLGDYARQLPAGYVLTVFSQNNGTTELRIPAGEYVNDGKIRLRAGGQYNRRCRLYLEGNTSFTGSGEVSMEAWDTAILGVANATLTIGPNQRLRGRSGSAGYGGITVPVVNAGLISADMGGDVLGLSGWVTNTGVISAIDGGRVEVSGAVTNQGLIQIQSGANVKLLGGTTNTGTIDLKPDGDLTLRGQVVWGEDLVSPTGAALRFSGAQFDNTGRTITADGGIVEITDSTITGGSLRATDNAASFVQFSGDVTLNRVAWEDPGAGEFRVYNTTVKFLGDYAQQLPAGYTLVVHASTSNARARLLLTEGTFRNDGVLELRATRGWGERALLHLSSDTILTGAGQVRMAGFGEGWVGIDGDPETSLTVGPHQTIRGSGELDVPIINEGTIVADLQNKSLTATAALSNVGVLSAINGGRLAISSAAINDLGILSGSRSSRVTFTGNLLGNTENANLYGPQGILFLSGSGTAAVPQLLEVMGRDLGLDPTGFATNFTYGTISLGSNTYVKLVDQAANTASGEPEALYVDSLIVPAGTTLDLNGLHLYARAVQQSGTVVSGTVNQVPDGGPVALNTPTSGAINPAGQFDEWTFFGRQGRFMTVAVHTGNAGSPAPISPQLGYAEVKLLDSAGNVVATSSNSLSGQTVLLPNVALPTDGQYRVQVHAPPAHASSSGNYVLSVWDVTSPVQPLQLNRQVVGQIPTPYTVDRWAFSAAANQQVRLDLVNNSAAGTTFALTGPDGWTGFSKLTADSGLITLPASGTYTLTVAGTGNTGAYAFQLLETTQTPLQLGEVYQGEFVGSAQAQLFRVNVPQSMPLRVTLDDSARGNRNELYAQFGSPPTRSVYDARYSLPASADQQILVPMAYAGTWYILVYGDYVPTPGSYTLVANTMGLILEKVAPDYLGNGQDAVLTLTGAGFEAGTTVALVAGDGTAYPASRVDVDSFTQLTATFDAGAVPAGTYSVRASQADGDVAQLSGAFEMLDGGRANLETNLVVPQSLGWRTNATIYVEYANTGNLAMPAPLLVLTGTNRPLMTLDQSRVLSGFWTSADPEGFSDTVQFLASGATPGALQPGESFRVPVYYIGLQGTWDPNVSSVDFSLGVLTTDDTTPVDWASQKQAMRPDWLDAETWEPIFANFVQQAGTTWGDYLKMLDDNAAYFGRLGMQVTDVTDLMGFELRQADGLSPLTTLDSAVDAAVPTPDLSLSFARAFQQPISRRYELGRFGRGWTDSWQISLRQDNGIVEIQGMSGTIRTFQPDSRRSGRYFAQPGDEGTLTRLPDGRFLLRESGGTQTAFRADGKLDYLEDTNGNRITAAHTGDLLTRLTHSSGASLTLAYNPAGRIVEITDSLGRATQFTYDAANEHLLAVREYDGRVTGYAYSLGLGIATDHALTEIAYPGGTHRYYSYDSRGRLQATWRDGGAEHVGFSYDSAGAVTATDAIDTSTTFYFDNRANVRKTVDPLGRIVQTTFDSLYNVTAITDPAGRSYTFAYDTHGNVTRQTDPLGNATSFTYTSELNRLASVTDANGNVTRYAYDAHGNLQAITYADGSRESWAYDSLGEATSWMNRRGNPIQYTYDSAGRITSKTYADGSHVDYNYDNARGNLISTVDATGTTSLAYDESDFLSRIDFPGGQWLQFTYNAAGQRQSSLDQLGHRLDYHYDAAGRLERMTDETAAQVVYYTYDPAGRIIRQDLGNGVYTTYEYDVASQLLHLVNHKPDGSDLSRFDYTYDSRGRRTTMGTVYGHWTYEYDDLGQLTRAVLDSTSPDIADQDLTYVYDALGNRIRTIENGVTTEYTTNSMNQYTKVGDTTYAFDADGNLVQETSPDGTKTYTYDSENRLIAVAAGTDSWQYAYDAIGTRVAATTNGSTTRYVVDPIGLGNVVGEYDAVGTLLTRYDYGLSLFARAAAVQSRQYYTFDAIASTQDVTNSTGVPVNSYAYDPFGVMLREVETVENAFQFVGGLGVMRESNGLDFMRARYYSSAMGRFTSPDPLGLAAGDVNLYRYAENIPVSLVDPTGLEGCVSNVSRDPVAEAMDFGERERGGGMTRMEKSQRWTRVLKTGTEGYATLASGSVSSVGRVAGGGALGGAIKKAWGDARRVLGRIAGEASPTQTNPANTASPSCNFGKNNDSDGNPDPDTKPKNQKSSSVVNPRDPNAKLGPGGFGSKAFVAPNSVFAYRVDFENQAKATAPAQQVFITDALDSNLDPATFSLTEFGFGDNIVTIPGGAQYFETTVPMTYNGVDFEVQIEAGIRPGLAEVYAIFRSIVPATGLPPDVLTGFLPPEDDTGRGMGHVSYTIRAKSGLPTGTQIRNVASIVFDVNEPITTNQIDPHDPSKGTDPALECLNTIDAGYPASQVLALDPVVADVKFLVSWAGDDDAGGSGIAAYDVYYRENDSDGNVDAQYQLWLQNTTATSAVFPYARREHSYSFYVVATDNVGHREAAPLAADAQTTVAPPLFRLGVAGDSLSDEYAEASYSYAKNWVESLAQDVSVGTQGSWGAPRDEGFEYNWAQAGATTTTLLADDQHTGLAQQITAGLIDYAVLAIGQNDFGPWTAAYLGIYSGTWTPAQTDAYVNQVVANIETALQTLDATGGKLVLSNVIDYGIAPLTRFWLPDPLGRERVTEAIRRVNTQLLGLARQYNVPLIDGFQATKDFLGSNAATMDTVAIGGVEFVNAAGAEPQNMFVDDGIHPHTVGQAVIANLVVEAIRLGYGQDVASLSFTEREMLELVGLGDQYTADTLGLVYSDYVILPGPPGGITVSPISRPTTEPNGTGTFTIVLNTQPLADVTIALHSSDATEGTVSPSSVTFTPGNWNVPQAVTVTGADDDQVDGDVVYAILTDPAVSTDGRYRGLDAADVAVANLDNDPHRWRNPRHWADVDDNGLIEPLDVLVLINTINTYGSRDLLVSPPPLPKFLFLDATGDDWMAPADVLSVINHINAHGSHAVADEPLAEGEDGAILAAALEGLATTPGIESRRDAALRRWAPELDVPGAIPRADRVRGATTLATGLAGFEVRFRWDTEPAPVRSGDDSWSLAASDKGPSAEQGAWGKRIRDRSSNARLAARMELDELELASDGSFELEDVLSEIVPDIASAWRRGTQETSCVNSGAAQA